MLEIFVIPGFGVAGISGIILVISGMVLSMVDNLGFKLDEMLVLAMMKALALVVTSMVISLIGSIAITRKLFGSRKLAFALNTEETVSEGYIGVEAAVSDVVGRVGIAYTVLRPSGKVMIDNEIYDAATVDGAYIEKGSTVKVVKYLTGQVFVEKV
jgi:membrane-bound serine protease (ClpP class)